jgi:hypothetical protein
LNFFTRALRLRGSQFKVVNSNFFTRALRLYTLHVRYARALRLRGKAYEELEARIKLEEVEQRLSALGVLSLQQRAVCVCVCVCIVCALCERQRGSASSIPMLDSGSAKQRWTELAQAAEGRRAACDEACDEAGQSCNGCVNVVTSQRERGARASVREAEAERKRERRGAGRNRERTNVESTNTFEGSTCGMGIETEGISR